MLNIKVLDRVANRLGRSAQAPRDASAHFGKAAEAEPGEAAGAAENLILFFLAEERELAALLDAILVGGQEGIHQRRNKTELTMAIANDRDADQAALAPAVDRLGGDAQLLADFVNRHHGFCNLLD